MPPPESRQFLMNFEGIRRLKGTTETQQRTVVRSWMGLPAGIPMTSALRLFTLLTLAGSLLIPLAAQQPTFKSGTKTVAVYATVTGSGSQLATGLTREDFEVRDSGKAQPITVFSNEVQPISVVVMLDRSGSMRGNFGLVESGVEAFVRQMLPADKARIGSFAEKRPDRSGELHRRSAGADPDPEDEAAAEGSDAAVERDRRGDRERERAGRPQRRPGLHRRRRQPA